MDKRALIFVALICLSSPSYGRSWLGPQEHHSDHGFGFKPYHHGGYGPDQDSDYDSSEENWHGNDFTDHHRYPEEYGHGHHHHINHGLNYGSHEFEHHHHGHGYGHHDFRNHNHGSHDCHEEHHHPSLGSSHNNNDGYKPGNQDRGHYFGGERRNSQNHGIPDLPRNNQGRDNEPNLTPRAIDNAGPSKTGSSIPIIPIVGPPNSEATDRQETGSSVTEPPKSGMPVESPGLPQSPDSRGDSDRVVFPDGPPSPITTITSSPLQPRLLATQAPVTSAPITQAPVTQGPTQASTTPLLEVVKCVRACPVTSEYNPVCGSNNVTYNNPGLMQCAKNCGVAVTMARQAPCPRPLPLPVLRFLAETFNVTVEEVSQRNKRAAPGDTVTEPPKTSDPLTKVPIDPIKDLPKANLTVIDVLLSALDDDLELLKKLRNEKQRDLEKSKVIP